MVEADLEQLYARLQKPIYNVVYRWVWNADDAHDVVQEAFVRLWRMRQRVQPGKVEPLVYKIAVNLAASRLRRRKIWRWLPLDALRQVTSGQGGADDELTRDEERARVREAVLALPEELRRIVMLCEFSDMTYAEIAEALSIPAGTVGSRRHRALKLLRNKLSGETENGEEPVRQTL